MILHQLKPLHRLRACLTKEDLLVLQRVIEYMKRALMEISNLTMETTKPEPSESYKVSLSKKAKDERSN